jgi:hypothetical protein
MRVQPANQRVVGLQKEKPAALFLLLRLELKTLKKDTYPAPVR